MLQQYAPAMRFMADYTMYYETTSKHLAEVRSIPTCTNRFFDVGRQGRKGSKLTLCFNVSMFFFNLVNLVNLVKRVNRSILMLFIIDGQALEDEGLDFNPFVAQIRTKHAGRCRVDLYVKTFSKPPKVPDL